MAKGVGKGPLTPVFTREQASKNKSPQITSIPERRGGNATAKFGIIVEKLLLLLGNNSYYETNSLRNMT